MTSSVHGDGQESSSVFSAEPSLLLHLGASKCGSTAVQAVLQEWQALGGGAGSRFAVWTAEGGVAKDIPRLTESDWLWVSKYRLTELSGHPGSRAISVLRSAAADQRLMMSSEQWLDDLRELAGDLPSRRRFRSWLRRLGMPVDVVCYIRPQLGWFTSAYLEWGLWAGLTPEEYCSDPHLLDYSNWSRTAELVRSLGFRKVLFRYRPDAVGDFFELCQLDMPAEAPLLERVFANGRSSEMLIKFLLRHPHLRPLHDSRVQLVASRLAPSSASGGQDAVSVLGAELADRLHAEFVDSNADLAGVLEAPQFADFCEAFEREREQHASPRAWLTTDEADEGMYTEFLERLLSACLEFLVDNPPKPGYSRIT